MKTLVPQKVVIGIDASRAARKNRSGTENYSFYLIKYLAKLDTKNNFILYSDRELPKDLKQEFGENVEVKILQGRLFWSQLHLARQARRDKLDVLFVPAHVLPFFYKGKAIVTIHGLEFEKFSEGYPFFKRMYLKMTTKWAVKKATQIISPSNATKNDLISFYRADREKINVIHHGSVFCEIEKEGIDCSKEIIKGRYLFFIGRLEKRKNLGKIIESFLILKEERSEYQDLKLVLAGSSTDYFEKLKKDLILKSSFKKDVIELGYVSDKEAYCLMKKASVFIFPSLVEGFGMPLLDAQYLDIPIVTSTEPPMNEISRNKTVLVDKTNVKDISFGVKKALNKDFNYVSMKSRFLWEETARKTLEAILKIANQ